MAGTGDSLYVSRIFYFVRLVFVFLTTSVATVLPFYLLSSSPSVATVLPFYLLSSSPSVATVLPFYLLSSSLYTTPGNPISPGLFFRLCDDFPAVCGIMVRKRILVTHVFVGRG